MVTHNLNPLNTYTLSCLIEATLHPHLHHKESDKENSKKEFINLKEQPQNYAPINPTPTSPLYKLNLCPRHPRHLPPPPFYKREIPLTNDSSDNKEIRREEDP